MQKYRSCPTEMDVLEFFILGLHPLLLSAVFKMTALLRTSK